MLLKEKMAQIIADRDAAETEVDGYHSQTRDVSLKMGALVSKDSKTKKEDEALQSLGATLAAVAQMTQAAQQRIHIVALTDRPVSAALLQFCSRSNAVVMLK